MLLQEDVTKLFNSNIFQKKYLNSDHIEAPAALPDVSLEFILDLCDKLEIKNIFEFGSGRSTKTLLEKGKFVTSLEDSEYWMNQTLKTISHNSLLKHSFFVRPLKFRLLGWFPVLDWKIDNIIARKIKEAELILIDSPHYTPFRESSLLSALSNTSGAIVIIDDTRIPTIKRFCDRIAKANNLILHSSVQVGHGFDVFYLESRQKVRLNHSIKDIIKGWFRYVQGLRFYAGLNKIN